MPVVRKVETDSATARDDLNLKRRIARLIYRLDDLNAFEKQHLEDPDKPWRSASRQNLMRELERYAMAPGDEVSDLYTKIKHICAHEAGTQDVPATAHRALHEDTALHSDSKNEDRGPVPMSVRMPPRSVEAPWPPRPRRRNRP